MAQQEYPTIHINDYLALDKDSQEARYEYLDGELRMLALADESTNHSIITTNVTNLLHRLLRDGPCKVYNTDMKLQLSETRYLYPDITITCDPRDQEPEDKRTLNPIVVVEVLSPSTEMVDRDKKLFYYQIHLSINHYIIIDSQRILIEVYSRAKDRWTVSTYGLQDEVPIASLAIQFSMQDAYEHTNLLRKAHTVL